MIDKQPWVEIDFRKPALVKAIKLLRQVSQEYVSLENIPYGQYGPYDME